MGPRPLRMSELEERLPMRTKLGASKDGNPPLVLLRWEGGRRADPVHHGGFGKVAHEMIRVEVDPFEIPCFSTFISSVQIVQGEGGRKNVQLNDDPVPFPCAQPPPTTLRLPSVTHIEPSSRQDQIPSPTKVLVALPRDLAPCEHMRQIYGPV